MNSPPRCKPPAADWAEVLKRMPGRIAMTHGEDGAYYTRSETANWCIRPALASTPWIPPVRAIPSMARWPRSGIWVPTKPCAAPMQQGRLSVTRAGAQGGMPTLAELEQFLKAQS